MWIKKRLLSFKYAFAGLADLFRSQPNAQIHLAAATAVTGAGFYFHISRMEWLVLIVFMALVIALEAVNTALEYLTDLASPQHHPLAGKAKDVAAAAVLVAAIGAILAAILIFFPKMSFLPE